MFRLNWITTLSIVFWFSCSGAALATGLLDGRVFAGMIGPSENPDLSDSLHFSDGHFWSDICTRCGFRPGEYTAEQTEQGIVFRGVLESDTRGRFDYEGRVHDDGAIDVSIRWERKRWYWTSSREIAFRGVDGGKQEEPVTLQQIRLQMNSGELSSSPSCARF